MAFCYPQILGKAERYDSKVKDELGQLKATQKDGPRTSRIQAALSDMHCDCVLLDAIVSIPKYIPIRIHGLRIPLRIDRPAHQGILTFFFNVPDVLPLTPGKFFMRTDELCLCPTVAVVNGHLNSLHVGFTSIGCWSAWNNDPFEIENSVEN